jgi:uncharacterized protein YndB with AHSA1/START domain
MHVIERRIEIDAPVARVFDFFSDFESFPRWMKNIREVHYTGRRFTRWSAEAPFGTAVEWEAETTHFEPGRRISWRSVRGDVDTEGEVLFEETRRGTTLLRVILGYAVPAGRFGEMVASLFGKNPQQQLEDDLERFATVVEGRRRSRRSARDEDEREADMRRQREPRFDERPVYGRRERRDRDFYADADRRGELEEETPYRERHARARFDEALRDARRSQMEGRRRYAEELERRERAHNAEYAVDARERDYERAERGGEPRRRGAEDMPTGERDEARSRIRRHALTPRERETERGRNEPDYGYSEQAFRRGVDKLMDEPPSRRWRRWE